MIDYAVVAVIFAAIGAAVGHYLGANPKAEALARSSLNTALAHAHETIANLTTKVGAVATPEQLATAATVAAAPVIPVPPVQTVMWQLGESYSSLAALAADLAGTGFSKEIRLNAAPLFNIGGGEPVDFYLVGTAVTQVKPT